MIQQFLDFLLFQRGISQNTVAGYRFDLEQYFAWLKARKLKPQSAKVRDIDAFLIELRKGGLTAQSVNRKMYCLKSFYRYLLRIEAVKKNPLEVFQNAKEKKRLPRYLTREQQEALLLAAGNGKYDAPWIGQRNQLVILFLLETGVRIGELCGLELKNIDLEQGLARVIGKGDKEREVILSDRLQVAIRDYLAMVDGSNLDARRIGPLLASRGLNLRAVCKTLGIPYVSAQYAIREGTDESGIRRRLEVYLKETVKPLPIKYLFFNEHGKGLCQRHTFRFVQEIGGRAGIDAFHPHICRHTFATNLRQKRADLLLIKEALGHASVSTTQIYAHLGNGEYREELKRLVNQT